MVAYKRKVIAERRKTERRVRSDGEGKRSRIGERSR